jgi:hypothetical protein
MAIKKGKMDDMIIRKGEVEVGKNLNIMYMRKECEGRICGQRAPFLYQ